MATGSTLKLPEELSIANVTEWKNKLIDLVNEPEPLLLEADQLARVDTAAMQLLLAFVRKASAANKSCQWQNPSTVLIETAEQLGLSQSLSLNAD
ncbi:STAS domain-containing protein [Neptuniibacter halophilus]|uniref:STAS domain-containing protein n=1 Tax=Neptuniibacter halophilus TaxID=651666 RepID=UPI00257488CF|nr:STAS domain-containing protein [Neptuniibacter halophilus]